MENTMEADTSEQIPECRKFPNIARELQRLADMDVPFTQVAMAMGVDCATLQDKLDGYLDLMVDELLTIKQLVMATTEKKVLDYMVKGMSDLEDVSYLFEKDGEAVSGSFATFDGGPFRIEVIDGIGESGLDDQTAAMAAENASLTCYRITSEGGKEVARRVLQTR